MKSFAVSSSCLILLSAFSGAVSAQNAAGIVQNAGESTRTIYTAPVAGLPIRLTDGLFVYAAAQVGAGSNSNVRSSETNARSSSTVVVRPNVVAEVKNSGNRYTLAYSGNYTNYRSEGDFNFKHHDLTLAGDTYFSARSRLALAVGSTDRTDEPGSTTNTQSSTVDRWTGRNLRGLYAYGADGAKGRFELEGSSSNKRYQNNLVNTAGADLDSRAVSGRFYWRVMPNTYATAELRNIDNDYINAKTNNNADNRALVGVTWDVTQITSGSLKFGQQKKTYDNRGDLSTGTYEAQITWAPRTYSTFTVNSRRTEEDATGFGSSVTNNQYGIDWAHAWSESVQSTVSVYNTDAKYRNSSARQDDTLSTTVGLKYTYSSNVGVALEFNNTERDSNTTGFNFKRNTVFAGLQVAL
jgi:hypothetical protein